MQSTEEAQGFTRSTVAMTSLKLLSTFAFLFIFLIGVNTLSASLKMMGSGFTQTLFNVSSNTMISFFTGVLATAILQSSSTTTSIIVGLCSSGAMTIGGAIPMIIGANLGTSVTNTLVSLSYMKNRGDFRKAFSASTVHDIFNLLTTLIVLPLEMATGFMEKLATTMASYIYGISSNLTFDSPIKASIKPATKLIKGLVTETLGQTGLAGGIVILLLAAVIIIASLSCIVKIMKTFVESHKTNIIEKVLSKNPYTSISCGIIVTVMVQSSSITTSLLVPLAGLGVLSTRSIFPVTIGANIGTTVTALIASLTGNMAGLSIALVHLIFNFLGMLIWYPSTRMRRIPIILAEKLGEMAEKRLMVSLAYIALLFFIFPLFLIYFF